jgi:ADP-ribose pyrophosphatase
MMSEAKRDGDVPIRMLSRKTIYSGLVTLHEDRVLINNQCLGKQLHIEYPESVLVVPWIDDDSVLMVRQYRYGLGDWKLEFPGGIVDSGESPAEAAVRELQEETGFITADIKALLEVYPDPSMTTQKVHVYAARGVKRRSKPALDDGEVIQVQMVNLDELLKFTVDGTIVDAVTLVGALFATKSRSKLM